MKKPIEAIENLRNSQHQLDFDGCEVGVSRQALCETLEWADWANTQIVDQETPQTGKVAGIEMPRFEAPIPPLLIAMWLCISAPKRWRKRYKIDMACMAIEPWASEEEADIASKLCKLSNRLWGEEFSRYSFHPKRP